MPFVLDASIAAYWAFDDEDHPVAPLALERIRTDEARVRRLWWFEVCNTITVSERRGRLTESHTATFPHGLRICASRLIGRRRRPILALAATAALQSMTGYLELARHEKLAYRFRRGPSTRLGWERP